VPSSTEEVAAALLAQAKLEATNALWRAVSEVVEDTMEARTALARVSADLEGVWRMKLAGKDTALEEKWLEKEAKLVAARLGLSASNAAQRALLATVNVLIALGSGMLTALLKVPIQLPPIQTGGQV
jgi:hypothetical protein